MLARVKKNDLVAVISGKDRGKQGHVIEIDAANNRVVVKDVAVATIHRKARSQNEKSGIVKEEAYISASKVMPVCSSCKKPCRVQVKVTDKNKARICHHCKEAF